MDVRHGVHALAIAGDRASAPSVHTREACAHGLCTTVVHLRPVVPDAVAVVVRAVASFIAPAALANIAEVGVDLPARPAGNAVSVSSTGRGTNELPIYGRRA